MSQTSLKFFLIYVILCKKIVEFNFKGVLILYSAHKLPSGSYRVRVLDYVDQNKKRHFKSFTAPTAKEAEFKAKEFEINNKKTAQRNPYSEITLQQAYQRYIDSKSAILSPSTIVGYKRYMKNNFKSLMDIKLKNLNQEIIQIAVNEMAVTHSPKSVRNAYGLLSAVLSIYFPSLKPNIRLPQKVAPEYIIPTTSDINKLLSEANNFIRVPIILAAFGSLRRSEVCALTVNDIFDNGILVNKAAVYDENRNIVIKAPKTSSSRRFVPISSEMIAEIRDWKYFNCTPATIDAAFKKLIIKCDVPKFSFHKLRHYFASELHAQGLPDKEIARIGGWETLDTLHNIYQHSMRDKQEEFNNKVITIFSNNLNSK